MAAVALQRGVRRTLLLHRHNHHRRQLDTHVKYNELLQHLVGTCIVFFRNGAAVATVVARERRCFFSRLFREKDGTTYRQAVSCASRHTPMLRCVEGPL